MIGVVLGQAELAHAVDHQQAQHGSAGQAHTQPGRGQWPDQTVPAHVTPLPTRVRIHRGVQGHYHPALDDAVHQIGLLPRDERAVAALWIVTG